jgi:FKBP-type peptidyl-prolyl cis-trans isomerase FkpA
MEFNFFHKYINILFVIFSINLVSCDEKSTEQKEVNWSKEKSIELNKVITLEEKIDIKLYLERHKKWKMVETGSGLQYFIYDHGDGDSVKTGMTVQLKHKVFTLDDKLCYETEEDEVLEVKIDHSEVETGLQEGLKKMRLGDKAKIIIPSHLAHGLTGDFNKIPPLTPIVVEVELVEILK